MSRARGMPPPLPVPQTRRRRGGGSWVPAALLVVLVVVGLVVGGFMLVASRVGQVLQPITGTPEQQVPEKGVAVPSTPLVFDKPEGWVAFTPGQVSMPAMPGGGLPPEAQEELERMQAEEGMEPGAVPTTPQAGTVMYRRGMVVLFVGGGGGPLAAAGPGVEAQSREVTHPLGRATVTDGVVSGMGPTLHAHQTTVQTRWGPITVAVMGPSETPQSHLDDYDAVVRSLRVGTAAGAPATTAATTTATSP